MQYTRTIPTSSHFKRLFISKRLFSHDYSLKFKVIVHRNDMWMAKPTCIFSGYRKRRFRPLVRLFHPGKKDSFLKPHHPS